MRPSDSHDEAEGIVLRDLRQQHCIVEASHRHCPCLKAQGVELLNQVVTALAGGDVVRKVVAFDAKLLYGLLVTDRGCKDGA